MKIRLSGLTVLIILSHITFISLKCMFTWKDPKFPSKSPTSNSHVKDSCKKLYDQQDSQYLRILPWKQIQIYYLNKSPNIFFLLMFSVQKVIHLVCSIILPHTWRSETYASDLQQSLQGMFWWVTRRERVSTIWTFYRQHSAWSTEERFLQNILEFPVFSLLVVDNWSWTDSCMDIVAFNFRGLKLCRR